MSDYIELERIESEVGVRLIATSQETQNTPIGKMSQRMTAIMAMYFTEQQGLDIAEGVKRRIEAGLPAGHAPYGYVNVRKDGRRVVAPHQRNAEVVRRIYELYAFHSHTIESLIRVLREEGVAYTDRQPAFGKTKLHVILTSRVYIGEVFWKGNWYPGSFEPLVDRRTWDRVQERVRGGTRQAHDLLYTNRLIVCAHCGGHLTGEEVIKNRGTDRERRYRYYRCSQLRTVPGHDKDWRFTESELDAQILKYFEEMRVGDAEVQAWFKDMIRRKTEEAQTEERDRLKEVRDRENKLEERRRRLVSMRIDGEIDAKVFAEQDKLIRDELAEVRLLREEGSRSAEEDADLTVKTFELSQNLIPLWVASQPREKRQILQFVGLNYVMEGTTLVMQKRSPFSVLGKTAISGDGGRNVTICERAIF